VRDIPPEDLVFIDEAGSNLAMVRLYARALKGQRAVGTRPQRRGKNVSLVEALTLNGPIATFQCVGSMDGLTFEAYLIQRVIPNLWPGACVILDNSPIHNSNEEIDAALKAVGARLIFLPPYSPDFSPIELFWSKVKDALKTLGPRTYQALKNAIAIAYEKVSLNDIRNWFAFRCYCTSSE
jgi:transposase